MDSLISLEGLSDVANNCIDKIASATGYICNRDTPKKIALKSYINDIQNSNLQPATKAVLIYNSKKNIKEWANQKAIVEKALPLISKKATPEKVDDDWLLSFFDKIRLVSDEEFQLIWARILAGEFDKPGSYSIRTLEKLKGLSKREAEVFVKVAHYSLSSLNDNCFIYCEKSITDEYFFFDDILLLEECGLISAQVLSFNLFSCQNEDNEACVHNSKLIAIVNRAVNNQKVNDLIIPCFSMTNSGRELLCAIREDNDVDLFVKTMKSLSIVYKNLFSFSVHRIIDIKDNGSIEYDDKDLLTR